MKSKPGKEIKAIETIGKSIRIEGSTNKSLVGLEGEIVWETKNTLKIKAKKKIITALKGCSVFKIDNHIINGKDLLKRSEERKNVVVKTQEKY
jgi:RNase P/RNase MRP subunit p29